MGTSTANAIPDLIRTLGAARLTQTKVVRSLHGEVSVHLSHMDAATVAGVLFGGGTLLPDSLTPFGIQPLGGSTTPYGCLLYLSDADGQRLAELVRRTFRMA